MSENIHENAGGDVNNSINSGADNNSINGGTDNNMNNRAGGDTDNDVNHITMSSRVRAARNITDTVFPNRMGAEGASVLLERIRTAFFDSADIDGEDFEYIDIHQLDSLEKMILVEKHLVSPDLIVADRPCAVILSKDESVSIMLNEEDHLRIQCIAPAESLDKVFQRCVQIERIFDSRFPIAFDQSFGYLTSCPTNLGTGMRISYMLHLPACVMSGHINNILAVCNKIGIAVRGIYGENSEASGNLFQFSNQGSLGRSEADTLLAIKNVRENIIGHENNIRRDILKQNRAKLEDRVCRAYGTLAHARILSSQEFMRLWSDVRMGVDMEIICDVDIDRLDRIVTQIQPATIQKAYGRMLNSEERDEQRARIVRRQLAGNS